MIRPVGIYCLEEKEQQRSTIMPVTFDEEQLSGSRLRCLMLTSGNKARVAQRLTCLVNRDDVMITSENIIMPLGFLQPRETVLLDPFPDFLSPQQRNEILHWWLAVTHGGNFPNWDIAATATVGGHPGLVLIEAKAHVEELPTKGKQRSAQSNEQNHNKIGQAIQEANRGLATVIPGCNLSRDSHYQLATHFAWSWKIASLGVPVVLVYLGFLNAEEMNNWFRSANDWADRVRMWSNTRVPATVWGTEVSIGGTLFVPLIRAIDIRFEPYML
jgi:hypothetical protein